MSPTIAPTTLSSQTLPPPKSRFFTSSEKVQTAGVISGALSTATLSALAITSVISASYVAIPFLLSLALLAALHKNSFQRQQCIERVAKFITAELPTIPLSKIDSIRDEQIEQLRQRLSPKDPLLDALIQGLQNATTEAKSQIEAQLKAAKATAERMAEKYRKADKELQETPPYAQARQAADGYQPIVENTSLKEAKEQAQNFAQLERQMLANPALQAFYAISEPISAPAPIVIVEASQATPEAAWKARVAAFCAKELSPQETVRELNDLLKSMPSTLAREELTQYRAEFDQVRVKAKLPLGRAKLVGTAKKIQANREQTRNDRVNRREALVAKANTLQAASYKLPYTRVNLLKSGVYEEETGFVTKNGRFPTSTVFFDPASGRLTTREGQPIVLKKTTQFDLRTQTTATFEYYPARYLDSADQVHTVQVVQKSMTVMNANGDFEITKTHFSNEHGGQLGIPCEPNGCPLNESQKIINKKTK